jgi:hypothetical protein
VAIEDAIAALPQHWEDVVTRLGTAKSEDLRGAIAAIGGPDHMAAVARIADLMVEGLPPEHPVRRALLEGELFAPATLDWPAVTGALRGLAEGLLVSGQHPGEQIIRNVASRLLRAPALTEDEVRRRGADPADPGLIRLDRPDGGGAQWPAFQFAPGSGPWSVVREVNYLLDAAAYPLGAADWWLSRNGWLDDQPSLLIGQVPDDRLIHAARAIRSEV